VKTATKKSQKKKLPGERPMTTIVRIANRIKRRRGAGHVLTLRDINEIIGIATRQRGNTGKRETSAPYTVRGAKR
jgi:hypothetical protein